MKIRRILVSQPRPATADKSPYNDLGVEVDYRPLIRVEGVNLKDFRSQRVEITEHSAVIFTSRTTIDHFFRIAAEARVSIPETMKYICNTEATALYLQKYIVYRKRKIFFADGSFKSLMELIMKHREERFLLVLSEPHKPELPETMRKVGIGFDEVILSRTVAADLSEVDWERYDMVVVFTPFEARVLAEACPTAPTATFGDGTTRKALECGLGVRVMAPTAAAPSMAKAIEIYMRCLARGEEPAPVVVEEEMPPSAAEEFLRNQKTKAAKRKKTT